MKGSLRREMAMRKKRPYCITVSRARFSRKTLFWGMEIGSWLSFNVESILKRYRSENTITGEGEISLELDTLKRPKDPDQSVWEFEGTVVTVRGAIRKISGLRNRRFTATFSTRTKRGAVTVFQ